MMTNKCKSAILIIATLAVTSVNHLWADNPLIMGQFTADPTARVFEGKIYVYPSHDILASPGKGRPGWFCMEDYHVFSSENLLDWTDHGVIVHQKDVPWAEPNSYSMWAPDCVFKDGRYYFYFPTTARGRGWGIGVAISDKPYGPFKVEPQPIQGARGIDPCVFIDKDGKAYLYYSMNRIFVARLKDNMVELDSNPQVIGNLPTRGLIEGPFVFERNGIYYLSYPHVQNNTERLEYAIASSPMGPFEQKGVIMDESPSGCWTNHHSIVEYKGQWYLFYHDKDLSPNFDKNRSIRADYLYFDEDGTIQKVTPTLRGVGIADATRRIQIDRYSAISPEGASVDFLDPNDTHKGWKVMLSAKDAWVRYNRVDFGKGQVRSVVVNACSSTGGTIAIRIDGPGGQVIAQVKIPKGTDWRQVNSALSTVPSGLHDLVVVFTDVGGVEIDWVQFN
ncbi:MAG: family 43 glycosylhydrolase [Sedimentisphaerales bacterium]|jgi:hypothetical protein|nr:family 43 glycosylhydrolase [Sedimentisphaerales bacterium]